MQILLFKILTSSTLGQVKADTTCPVRRGRCRCQDQIPGRRQTCDEGLWSTRNDHTRDSPSTTKKQPSIDVTLNMLHLTGLCSVLRPCQHSIDYMGDGFYRSKDPTNSIKVLKEKAAKENNPRKNKENTNYTYAYRHKIGYKYSIHE